MNYRDDWCTCGHPTLEPHNHKPQICGDVQTRMVRLACRALYGVDDDEKPYVFQEVLREKGYIIVKESEWMPQ